MFLLAILFSPVRARADTYRLLLPRNAPAPVQFGAAELAQALAEAGHHPGQGRQGIVVTVTTRGPGGPEAFAIQRRGAGLRVDGGDAVGAMYGLMEVGEQAVESGGQGLLQAVRPAIRRPYLPLRVDSPTLWLGANGELPPLLEDGAFWRSYLAALARGRFNVLHLHGFVDPATSRPQSLLERLMPATSAPDAGARRFVSELRSLAGLCRDYGIRLALTDDAASEAPAAAISAPRLLAAIPGLWGLGARATGPGAAALQTVLARRVAPRAFLAWPEPASGDLYRGGTVSALPPPGRALMILPANAGSFALPYPLLAIPSPLPDPPAEVAALARVTPPTPSGEAAFFADPRFLQPGRRGGARLLWDVPAGRIAPALPWCDPDFIRRLVRSIAMMAPDPTGAPGLLVEPPQSFFSSFVPHLSSVESTWWWHRTWGRLAYDPSEPDSRLVAAFQRRYGQEPGWHIQQVLARASSVVPLIAAVDAGPTADGASPVPEREPETLEEWEGSASLDANALVDVPTWAKRRLAGETNGRLDPIQISFRLAETAMRIRNEVDTIEILHPRHREEWHTLRRQIEALCHLADFGARRLSAAAHLELHRRTGDEMELELASGHATLAAISWAAMQRMLAPGGEREVGQMTMPRQPPVPEGPFAVDAAAIARRQDELAQEIALPRAVPRIAHVPIQHATPTRAQRITATVMSGPHPPVVTLIYRLVDRDGTIGPEHERPMSRLFETRAFYQAEIQGPELTEGFLEYRIRAAGDHGAAAAWPGPEEWRRVPVTRDEAGPTIQPLRPVASPGSALFSCEVTDPSGVGQVWLHMRPLAARAPWRAVEMTPVGTCYSAQVLLSGDGLQYRFEAVDPWGNRSMAPDVTTETPYLVLLPAARRSGAMARSSRVMPGR